MNLPNLNDWERKPDWAEIVKRVGCRLCGAKQGELCLNLSSAAGTLAGDAPRSDFHQYRKFDAIAAYLHDGTKTIEAAR